MAVACGVLVAHVCPVAALTAWRAHRNQAPDLHWAALESLRRERPVFGAVTKSGQVTGAGLLAEAVVRLIEGAALRAGLDPERYSGHSLRSDLATAAGDAGAAFPDLMRQTRHRSTQAALARVRPADPWRNNAIKGVFETIQTATYKLYQPTTSLAWR